MYTALHNYFGITVVLHEIGHGLGFAGFGAENGGLGYIRREESGLTFFLNGSSEYASVWDTFIQGRNEGDNSDPVNPILPANAPILQQGPPSIGWNEASTDMLGEFQSSGIIRSFGPIAMGQNGGNAVNLFAPTPFNGGSSYSHWDEITFDNTPNALMTPFAARGESNHDPGNVTLGFMEDMGWELCQGSLALSTEEFTLENVKISPNPFTKSITIELPPQVANQEFNISIVDINGRIITNTKSDIVNGEITISNLSNLKNALYFLNIESATSELNITKKIIKK